MALHFENLVLNGVAYLDATVAVGPINAPYEAQTRRCSFLVQRRVEMPDPLPHEPARVRVVWLVLEGVGPIVFTPGEGEAWDVAAYAALKADPRFVGGTDV